MRQIILIAALVAALFLTGCTDAQIKISGQLVQTADEKLTEAEAVLKKSEMALVAARQFAEMAQSQMAIAAVAKAEAAVTVVQSSVAVAKDASAAAHLAHDSAKAAHAAGGSTVDVIIAVITTLIPTVGGLLVALRKLTATATAFRQTVRGIDEAKKSMPAEQVEQLHTELAVAQDENTKLMVDKAQV